MRTARTRWTEEETFSLITQVQRGKVLSNIRISGRTYAAITNKLVELRASGRLTDRPPRKLHVWNIREINTLERLVKVHRFSAARIARLSIRPFKDRTLHSISQQMRRRRLGQSRHRTRARAAHRLSKAQSRSLNAFLMGKGNNMPAEKVAALWSVEVRTIRVRRHRLQKRNSSSEAVPFVGVPILLQQSETH